MSMQAAMSVLATSSPPTPLLHHIATGPDISSSTPKAIGRLYAAPHISPPGTQPTVGQSAGISAARSEIQQIQGGVHTREVIENAFATLTQSIALLLAGFVVFDLRRVLKTGCARISPEGRIMPDVCQIHLFPAVQGAK